MLVEDADTGQRLPGKLVKLFQNTNDSRFVQSDTSNAFGYAEFQQVPFNTYRASFEGDSVYAPRDMQFQLQSNSKTQAVLYLNRKSNRHAYLYQFIKNDKDMDRDLNLSVVSSTGKECKVNPSQRYCAHAIFQNDVQQESSGYERIKLDHFTESYYLAYLSDTPRQSYQCAVADQKQFPYYLNEQVTVRSLAQAQTIYYTLYCFTGWGLNSRVDFRQTFLTEPSASLCEQFYPRNTKYSLSLL